MEISEIQKAGQIRKVQKKESLSHASQIEDKVSISVEAEKRVKWVEMLKAMPDVRSTKIEEAIATSLNSEINRRIADKLLNEII